MRNERIDTIKGLAILLVIVGHIVQFNVTGGGTMHVLYKWIYLFHMNLFFFCSGLLFKGLSIDRGIQNVGELLIKKCKRILVPYLFWSVVVWGFQCFEIKLDNGLWFLRSLFLYNVCFIIGYYVIHQFADSHSKFVEYAFLALLLIIGVALGEKHFCFFWLGIIYQRYERVRIVLSNRYFVLVSALLFLTSGFYWQEIPLPAIFVSFVAVVSLYHIHITYVPNLIRKQLCFLGEHSMPIFLLHFFILFGWHVSFFPVHPLLLFATTLPVAILVAYICVICYKISHVGFLPALLWGDKIKRE